MNIDTEMCQKVQNLGALGYPLAMVMNVLCLPPDDRPEFEKLFNDPQSDVFRHYGQGKDIFNFEVDTVLYRLAKTGDIKSLKELEGRQKRYLRNYEL